MPASSFITPNKFTCGFFSPSTGGGGGFNPENLTGLMARYFAGYGGITATALDVPFTSANVDTANDRVQIANQTFDPLTSGSSQFAFAVPTYIGSTGAVPGGLTSGIPYFSRWDTDGYNMYGVTDADDYLGIPGQYQTETPILAQNMIQQVNRVNITSGGTGTHRWYTDPLAAQVPDMYGDPIFTMYANSSSNKQTHQQIITDPTGYKYFKQRLTSREFRSSAYNIFGPLMSQGNSTADKQAVRDMLAGSRIVIGTVVIRPYELVTDSPDKAYITAADVSGSVITNKNYAGSAASHPWGTSNSYPVKLQESTGPVPANMNTSDTVWVHGLTASTLSLYPTEADADANTNVITPDVTSGLEKFLVYGTNQIGDYTRQQFLWCIYGTTGATARNIQAPRLWQAGPTSSGIINMQATTVGITGSNNGNWFLTASASTPNFPDLTRVYFQVPPASVAPTRTDTGLPQAAGYYYVTRDTNIGRIRCHPTLENAQANVGVATSSGSFTGIKYNNVTPSGEAKFYWADGKVGFSTNLFLSSQLPTLFNSRIPLGEASVVSFVTDYNNPLFTYPVLRVFVNGVLTDEHEYTDIVKGLLPARDSATNTAICWRNDVEPHVPDNSDQFDVIFQCSATDIPDSEIIALHNYMINVAYPSLFSPTPPSDNTFGLMSGDGLMFMNGDEFLLMDN